MKRRIAELGVAALLVLAAGVHWGLGPWLAGSGDDSLDSRSVKSGWRAWRRR
jgi:hypothetical protein